MKQLDLEFSFRRCKMLVSKVNIIGPVQSEEDIIQRAPDQAAKRLPMLVEWSSGAQIND